MYVTFYKTIVFKTATLMSVVSSILLNQYYKMSNANTSMLVLKAKQYSFDGEYLLSFALAF